jgi:hypothetical protein
LVKFVRRRERKEKEKDMRVTRLGCGPTKLEVKLGWAVQLFDYNKKYKFLKICFKMVVFIELS